MTLLLISEHLDGILPIRIFVSCCQFQNFSLLLPRSRSYCQHISTVPLQDCLEDGPIARFLEPSLDQDRRLMRC
jgi:hypothetical protein